MSSYECEFCGFDGGFHGCREQVKTIIANYFTVTKVLDADELADLIGSCGYYQTRDEANDAYV